MRFQLDNGSGEVYQTWTKLKLDGRVYVEDSISCRPEDINENARIIKTMASHFITDILFALIIYFLFCEFSIYWAIYVAQLVTSPYNLRNMIKIARIRMVCVVKKNILFIIIA